MKRLHIGQSVKLANPVSIAARFYSQELGGIVGAGNQILPRSLLDAPAYVVSLATGSNCQRGLIAFGSLESNQAMWLDIETLEKGDTKTTRK